MKLYRYLLLLLLLTSYINADTIAQQWERSPQHKEYLQAMEAGDLQKAMEIKKATVSEILKVELKDYIADFKDKYEAKYLNKISRDLPPKLIDLLKEIYIKVSSNVPKNNPKMRNDFVKYLYRFIKSYNLQDGNTQKELNKLFLKTIGIENTSIGMTLKEMAKSADSEASKSPEQKRKEYEEYMQSLDKRIAEDNKRIADGNKRIAEEKRKQAEWDIIIKQLKSL